MNDAWAIWLVQEYDNCQLWYGFHSISVPAQLKSHTELLPGSFGSVNHFAEGLEGIRLLSCLSPFSLLCILVGGE